jgi:anti-anti-sigma factor
MTSTVHSSDEPFSCEVRRAGARTVVSARGELDLDTVRELEAAIQEIRGDGATDLVLDLRGLTFMDSAGLTLLIALSQASARDGFTLGIVPDSAPVQRLLELTGASVRLPLVDAAALDGAAEGA